MVMIVQHIRACLVRRTHLERACEASDLSGPLLVLLWWGGEGQGRAGSRQAGQRAGRVAG